MTRFRKRGWLAVFVAAVFASLSIGVAPATADSRTDGVDQMCWIYPDDSIECFGNESAMLEEVADDLDANIISDGDVVARPDSGFSTLSLYVLATFYTGANYTGTGYQIGNSSSTVCTTGSGLNGNFGTGPNNTISSYKTYLGCAGRIFDGANQTGTYNSFLVNAPTLGSMDNKASSYRLV